MVEERKENGKGLQLWVCEQGKRREKMEKSPERSRRRELQWVGLVLWEMGL